MSLRKRPSSNSQMSLLNRALTSGTVSQRADNSDELEQRSTAQAAKKVATSSSDKSAAISEKRGAVSQRAKKITQPGETSTPRADDIMDEIRSLGYYPKEHGATRKLAEKRRRAEDAGEFSISQLEELKTMKEQQDEKARTVRLKTMEEIRALGYIPIRVSKKPRHTTKL